MVIGSILDPVLNPLLQLSPFLAIFSIALLVSVIITLFYKWFTDQDLMKRLKDEMKTMQKEMKTLKDHPEQMMKVQKKVMQANSQYMMKSMKPTLVTFLPIILIFSWLNVHLAFEPLLPDQPFMLTADFKSGTAGEVSLEVPKELTLLNDATQDIALDTAAWSIKGPPGLYEAKVNFQNEVHLRRVRIGAERAYEPVAVKVKGSMLKRLTLSNAPLQPAGDFSLFGWHPGWLAWYIMLSILFSISLRKLLKIY